MDVPARQYFRYPVSKPDRTFIKIADMGLYFEVVVPFDYPYGKDFRGRVTLLCARSASSPRVPKPYAR